MYRGAGQGVLPPLNYEGERLHGEFAVCRLNDSPVRLQRTGKGVGGGTLTDYQMGGFVTHDSASKADKSKASKYWAASALEANLAAQLRNPPLRMRLENIH